VFWFILLLAVPIITMRLFALEKSSGTFETLMTTPISDIQVVAAKFIAALVFYMVMWLPMLACPLIVQRYSSQSTFDPGAVGSTYLGIVLLGCPFLAIGCFASAISRSQMIAAMVSLVVGVSLFLFSFLPDQIPSQVTWQSQLLSCFTLLEHMHDFARGVVDTRPVIVYLSLTAFFLFLTLRAVESRRWK
jgi:ABC-2 type transport system permease protein